MGSPLLALVLLGAGLFSVLGAALNWNFFLNSRRARLFMRLFGRNGTRIVYLLLGSGLVVLGVMGLLNPMMFASRR